MNPAYLHLGHYKPDWGDVPTWTAAALALIAGLVAYRVYLIESRRDVEAASERRQRDEGARRAQAEKIAAWFAPIDEDELEPEVFGAYVRNASELPVFDVFPVFHPAADGEPIPGTEHFSGAIAVLPPSKTMYVESALSEEDFEDVPNHLRDSAFLVEITFRDAAGVRWIRDADGKLTEETWRSPADG